MNYARINKTKKLEEKYLKALRNKDWAEADRLKFMLDRIWDDIASTKD